MLWAKTVFAVDCERVTLVFYRKRAFEMECVLVTMPWRAFDKTVSRKPLAFAVDAVYGNSIDLGLETIAKKGVAGKLGY